MAFTVALEQFLVQPLEQIAPVVAPGQGVGVRRLMQTLLDGFQLGDIDQ